MRITIHLVPELETEVRAVAQQVGVAPDRYVVNLLSEHLSQRRTTLPVSEATLLKQVNLGLSASGATVSLYHPRSQAWRDHFGWDSDAWLLIGLTPTGRATIDRLDLNRVGVVNLRALLATIGKHPPY